MYILSIILCVFFVGLFSAIFTNGIYKGIYFEPFKWAIIITFFVLFIDGLVAFFVRKILPLRYFNIDKKYFSATNKEAFFYEKLGIKKWKDKVLELGFLAGFSKKSILRPKDNEYLKRYIIEANYGIAVHFYSIILGFLVVFLTPKIYKISIGISVALINSFYNYLSVAILRYNLVKLRKLYELNERKAKRKIDLQDAEKVVVI